MSQLIASNYLKKLWITFSTKHTTRCGQDQGANSSPYYEYHDWYEQMENGERQCEDPHQRQGR